MNEMRQFELYRDHAWPVHRRLVKLARRCSRCILSEVAVSLRNGICEACLSPVRSHRSELTRQLSEVVCRAMDGESWGHWDALVMFSGGKDSTYMIHRLLSDYPEMRILALTVDNTFMSPDAIENARDVAASFGIEHVVYRPPSEVMERMFRAAFLHRPERGCAATVDQFDGDFFCDVGRNLAAQFRIPMMFVGLSTEQVERIMGLSHFQSPDDCESRSRKIVAGIPLGEVFTESEIGKHWWAGDANAFLPAVIYPLYAWNVSETEIRRELASFGLLREVSPLVTNSQLIPLMCLVDMARIGYSSFEPEFAQSVRDGRADRKTWLHTFEMIEYAARTGHFIGRDTDRLLGRLNLTREDVGLAA